MFSQRQNDIPTSQQFRIVFLLCENNLILCCMCLNVTYVCLILHKELFLGKSKDIICEKRLSLAYEMIYIDDCLYVVDMVGVLVQFMVATIVGEK